METMCSMEVWGGNIKGQGGQDRKDCRRGIMGDLTPNGAMEIVKKTGRIEFESTG